jgi:hypothetical protein
LCCYGMVTGDSRGRVRLWWGAVQVESS